MRETSLSLDDVVMPPRARARGSSVPWRGFRESHSGRSDESLREAGELAGAGVRAVLLFGIPEVKDADGSGAWDDDGIVQRALRALAPRPR